MGSWWVWAGACRPRLGARRAGAGRAGRPIRRLWRVRRRSRSRWGRSTLVVHVLVVGRAGFGWGGGRTGYVVVFAVLVEDYEAGYADGADAGWIDC